MPGTRPVGGGRCGRSAEGVEDFAGQVLQWVADVRPHHGVQFQLMKGASWFHEDPVNFRTASGWWAYATFTCLHTDSTVGVPSQGRATTRQVFWFLEGSLDDLLARFRRDLAPAGGK